MLESCFDSLRCQDIRFRRSLRCHATKPGLERLPAGAAASTPGPSAGSNLPYSDETTRALRAAKEQAVRQGCMFAGPDQLLLGILAAAGGGTSSASSAAALLVASLGGSDVDSVREWLNEQTGLVAPMVYGGSGGGRGGGVSSSRLRPSDVEFTAGARKALSQAQGAAEAMGSRSVGTYHMLLVLTGGGDGNPETATHSHSHHQKQDEGEEDDNGNSGGRDLAADGFRSNRKEGEEAERVRTVEEPAAGSAPSQPPEATQATSSRPPSSPAEDQEAAGAEEGGDGSSGGPAGGGRGRPGPPLVLGLLPALLHAVGADVAVLRNQRRIQISELRKEVKGQGGKLLALCEGDAEAPCSPGSAAVSYREVVAHLRETYKRQAALPYHQRDEAAFRRATSQSGNFNRDAAAAAAADDDEEEEDPYE
ncbi:hypothetical protein VOLCADRAFT_88701 [Volvox carteri f. nagariensis]|uniref:Clp R domain-containing protein n=1 Tax=Volvox carteri f. nagariensis TaxID=3068 RepID=D8TPQ5_VOLCA|nr:uncharacterized protein VOLCADRAFT_88701 [Volvox carteri f. nagariensis]EFJ50656.1 hypothetical protein VOLCADRAFT_88701 [Volvox carteri f. nagariensis]|eukprot:XP_002948249.1 hypothetical protein VOLCADRAFT_88701 [Volvox carteri f. nagariensis]